MRSKRPYQSNQATVRRKQPKFAYLRLGFSFLIAALFAIYITQNPVERAIQNIRDSINSRPASGTIHVVEIDAKSLQKLQRWPWPRRYHAQLIDQLNAAGVDQITFDVDFSSHSGPREDTVFAAAIARAGGKVVLPTFRQAESSQGSTVEVESLPIEILRKNSFLGSVNVHPDGDGQVNSYPYGTITGATPRPSIAALLADSNGPLDVEFKIDQSVSLASIPKHSFADIISGKFDKNALKGKKVIVGATAIEIGDRYATSRYGVIPGVLIQTMAAETLLAKMDLPNFGGWPMLFIIVAALIFWIHNGTSRGIAGSTMIAMTALTLLMVPLLAERLKLAHFDLFPALLMLIIFLSAQYVASILQKLAVERRVDRDTGLANFASWQIQNRADQYGTVIVAGIANFQAIISTLDETDAGNFMRAIASRLEIATGGTQLFRIGREQFCWKIESNVTDDINHQVEAVSSLFNAPLLINGRPIRATICFGAASGNMAEPATLSSKAGLAAKKASETGTRIAWHDDGLAENTDISLSIVSQFEEALENGEISVVYQPKYSTHANRVVGAEALIRWSHPVRGAISPAVFVPILEQENLMEALTVFVLQQLLEELPKWNAFGEKMSCAINVSASLLTNSTFTNRASGMIKDSGIDPALITIELTETAALSSLDQAERSLKQLKNLGAQLSIDDYGTGQSTLSYLRKFDVDEVKIDQSFIRSLTVDTASRIMVQSTIELAKALQISVVAEGVEDAETLKLLAMLGCDNIQGWHIGKPGLSDHFIENWCQSDGSKAILGDRIKTRRRAG